MNKIEIILGIISIIEIFICILGEELKINKIFKREIFQYNNLNK